MPRRNHPRSQRRGQPAGPMFGDVQPRIGDPAREHYEEDYLSDDDVLAAYRMRTRWLFRTSRGMNMWEGPDGSQVRQLVIGIMYEGTPEAVILHASRKEAQRHSGGPETAGDAR
jgi:hypothetical protein